MMKASYRVMKVHNLIEMLFLTISTYIYDLSDAKRDARLTMQPHL